MRKRERNENGKERDRGEHGRERRAIGRRKKHRRRKPTSFFAFLPLSNENKKQEQPGALRLTGILGLAAALYLWWAIGGGGGGGAPRPRPPGESEGEEAAVATEATTAGATSTSSAAAAAARTKTSSSVPLPPSAAAPQLSPATLAARAALRGASTVSVSAPGVLLRECEGGGLESGATPRAGAPWLPGSAGGRDSTHTCPPCQRPGKSRSRKNVLFRT